MLLSTLIWSGGTTQPERKGPEARAAILGLETGCFGSIETAAKDSRRVQQYESAINLSKVSNSCGAGP